LEPEPTFTFVVPLQPSVDPGDYRSVRLDFHVPEVDDDQVNRAMRQLQEEQALVEESHQPVALGNRVTMELYAKVRGEETGAESTESHESEHHHDESDDHDHDHGLGGNEFIHEHNAVMVLSEESEEPAPGFKQNLIGMKADEEKIFDLTYPDDAVEYEELAGKQAEFKVKVKKIEVLTLPELTEDFAARVTEKEEKPLTLLELRIRMRENLQKMNEQRAKSEYVDHVLDELVEKGTVAYPQVLINDQTENYLQRLDQDFRRQGITLQDYMQIANKDRDAIKTEYQPVAIRNIKRSLILREIIRRENIQVNDEDIEREIERMLERFGEQGPSLRSALDTPSMRENIKNDLVEQRVLERIAAIAKGEAPELSPSLSDQVTTANQES
jgi:trigger factor